MDLKRRLDGLRSKFNLPKHQVTVGKIADGDINGKDSLSVVAWGECQSTPTNTRGTKCGVKFNDLAHQNCKEVTAKVEHIKKVPECKEITKNNCVTDWEVDSNGNKVWAGTETCTPVTWAECELVEKTVEFPTVKTECDVDSQIKWTKFVDTPTNIVGLESKCEVFSSGHQLRTFPASSQPLNQVSRHGELTSRAHQTYPSSQAVHLHQKS